MPTFNIEKHVEGLHKQARGEYRLAERLLTDVWRESQFQPLSRRDRDRIMFNMGLVCNAARVLGDSTTSGLIRSAHSLMESNVVLARSQLSDALLTFREFGGRYYDS